LDGCWLLLKARSSVDRALAGGRIDRPRPCAATGRQLFSRLLRAKPGPTERGATWCWHPTAARGL